MVIAEKKDIVVIMPPEIVGDREYFFNILITSIENPELVKDFIVMEIGIDDDCLRGWIMSTPVRPLKVVKVGKQATDAIYERLTELGAKVELSAYGGMWDIIQYF